MITHGLGEDLNSFLLFGPNVHPGPFGDAPAQYYIFVGIYEGS